jgi:hypothetical protein
VCVSVCPCGAGQDLVAEVNSTAGLLVPWSRSKRQPGPSTKGLAETETLSQVAGCCLDGSMHDRMCAVGVAAVAAV